MNTTLLILFISLNVANVIIQTIKSIATIKCKPITAAMVNAIAYGLYTVVLVYMVCDLPLWEKVVIVGGANLIGVYFVKYFEEKARKDKLWKVEVTIPTCAAEKVDEELHEIPHSYITLSEKHTLFNVYCTTQVESKRVREIVNQYGAKYFVAESMIL